MTAREIIRMFLFGLIVVGIPACMIAFGHSQKNSAYDNNINASRNKEACFAAGGAEYQFHEYNFTGTCVYRKAK